MLSPVVAFAARVSTIKLAFEPFTYSGSSALRGINTDAPALGIKSRPWSKNCPKSVNHESYPAETL